MGIATLCLDKLGPKITREVGMSVGVLEPGMQAPHFSLTDQEGKRVALSDFRGKKVILYFYPAASTPGCTTQACDFRDNMGVFQKAGYVVLGVSKDKLPSIQKFAKDENLSFPLLSDENLSVHNDYGTFGEKSMYGKTVMGVIRSTFVVGEDGALEHAFYNVKATGHVDMLRKKLGLTS